MSIDSLTPSTANAGYPADWEEMFDLSAANHLRNQRQKALARLGLYLWTGSKEQVAALQDITLEQEREQERNRRQAQHG